MTSKNRPRIGITMRLELETDRFYLSRYYSEAIEAALRAYTQGDYTKAVQILQAASQAEPRNGEIHLLLAKTYFEMEERDRAIASAEALAFRVLA